MTAIAEIISVNQPKVYEVLQRCIHCQKPTEKHGICEKCRATYWKVKS